MSVKLHKENIKLNEVLCSDYGQTTIESDLIVPDINPDVLKVLRVSARAYITQKTVQQDRAYVQGVVKLNILYIPETFECGKIKAINTTLDFSHIFEAKGAKSGMNVSAEAECENITSSLLNSRKLNIRCTIGLSIKICVCSEKEIAISIPENEGLELKCSPLKLLNSTTDTDKEFVVSDKFSLPSGKPPVGELLKLNAKASSTELRLAEGKAVIKGELALSILYSSPLTEEDSEDSGNIEFFDFTLPFTEVLDVFGIKENMEGEIDFSIKDITYRLETGDGGENTCIAVDVVVGAFVKGTELMEISVIEDAYSTCCNIKTEKKSYDIERLLDKGYIQIPLKEILEVPEYLPEISKVCDISAIPSVTDISISGDCALVKGIININMLYLTRSMELPVAGFDKTTEFSHSFCLSELCENSICEAKVLPEHLSYTLSGDKSLELRIINSLSIKCMSTDKTEIVDFIEEDETPLTELPSVVIYFVQPGDSIWNIAKRFYTSIDKIAENNHLESDNLIPGQKLLIIR